MKSFLVALDLLREARSRKWFLALGGAITLVLAVLGVGLKLDVVDGALAASRFFGHTSHGPIEAADVALRPVFAAASQLMFYGGLLFGIFACSDFAPKMLAPGRIEHLLSLPVRRWELLVGTFLGVLTLALAAALYGAGGITLLFGIKAGVWTIRPLLSGLLAVVAFATVYAGMLAASVFVRSAPVATGVGIGLSVLGILASSRDQLMAMFSSGLARDAFGALTYFAPRLARLGNLSAELAASHGIFPGTAQSLLAGCGSFAAALLALGLWHFEGKDF